MFFMDSQVEKDREFMINWSNNKVEQHIKYILGSIGGLYAAFNILINFELGAIKKPIHILLIFYTFSFILFNVGKMVYWSVINQYIFNHKPTTFELKENESDSIDHEALDAIRKLNETQLKLLEPNNKWGLINAAKLHIALEPPYNKLKRGDKWFQKFRMWIARQFIGLKTLIISIGVPLIIWIIWFGPELCNLIQYLLSV